MAVGVNKSKVRPVGVEGREKKDQKEGRRTVACTQEEGMTPSPTYSSSITYLLPWRRMSYKAVSAIRGTYEHRTPPHSVKPIHCVLRVLTYYYGVYL